MTALGPGVIVNDTWELEALLGRGGMGEVWQVRHTRLAHKVAALKTLGALQVDDVALTRFRHEAETIARLEHPNIVQLFDYGALPSGAPWLVMELLRGESLRARLDRGVMTVDEVRRLVSQVTSALVLAHAHGVVHRDLKPDNLFLVATPQGPVVKVVDFGIAKLASSKTLVTGNEMLLGTPTYMSPEQARAENDQLTTKSDVFSLASVCHEALSGTAPFRDETPIKSILRIVKEPAPTLSGLEPAIVEALAAAFEKDPERRCSMEAFGRRFSGELVIALRPVVAPRAVMPVRELATTKVERPLPLSPKSPSPRWWLLGVASVVVASVGWAVLRDTEPAPPLGAAPVVAVPAMPEPTPPNRPRAPSALEAPDSVPAPVSAPTMKPRKTARRKGVTPEQEVALRALEAALAEGRYGAVLDGARHPLIRDLQDTTQLQAMASCGLGRTADSRAFASTVNSGRRALIEKFCRALPVPY